MTAQDQKASSSTRLWLMRRPVQSGLHGSDRHPERCRSRLLIQARPHAELDDIAFVARQPSQRPVDFRHATLVVDQAGDTVRVVAHRLVMRDEPAQQRLGPP